MKYRRTTMRNKHLFNVKYCSTEALLYLTSFGIQEAGTNSKLLQIGSFETFVKLEQGRLSHPSAHRSRRPSPVSGRFFLHAA